MSPRTPSILLSLAALVLVAACSGAAGGAPTPSAASPTTTTVPLTPTAAPTTAPTVTVAPTSAGQTAIHDGTYVTMGIPDSDIVAKINADTSLSAAQRTDALNVFSRHQSETFKLTLSNGAWTEFEAWDGGSFEVGARATFVSPDTHTLLIQESCCGLTTFDVTPSGTGFALKIRSNQPNSAEDALLDRIVYESAPFVLVP